MAHLPVMLAEALDQLALKADGVYVDCTFGRGGHSQAMLTKLGRQGRLLALDRDIEAIQSPVAQSLAGDQRLCLLHSRFSALAEVAESQGLSGGIDGILMDLGVSSPQLDNAGRGFSFLRDGPLDMRMDCSQGLTAAQWLAEVPEQELVKVLFDYGEERFAKRIAKAIVTARAQGAIVSTRQLAQLAEAATPVKDKHKHPATRTFQAIRIAVNQELDEIAKALEQAAEVLKPGGRLVVISFHSLEDRLVKRFIRGESGYKYDPGRLPVKESEIAKGRLCKIGKAVKAGPEEVAVNPRSRSAVMRVAERV